VADEKAKGKMDDDGIVNAQGRDQALDSTRGSNGWEPQLEVWAKLNMDVSLYPSTGEASSSIVF
jgi:hypothetical protein